MSRPDRHRSGQPGQLRLEDPVLEEIDAELDHRGRCRGQTVAGKRCKLTAPTWWDTTAPWWCRTHQPR